MKVNLIFIEEILYPLRGGADDDDLFEKYRELDPNNEHDVKNVIEETIKQEFVLRSNQFKEKVKLALRYSLLSNSIDFQRVYDSNLLPFDSPNDARDFFRWIWEVLYGEEQLKIDDIHNYLPVFDRADTMNTLWNEPENETRGEANGCE